FDISPETQLAQLLSPLEKALELPRPESQAGPAPQPTEPVADSVAPAPGPRPEEGIRGHLDDEAGLEIGMPADAADGPDDGIEGPADPVMEMDEAAPETGEADA